MLLVTSIQSDIGAATAIHHFNQQGAAQAVPNRLEEEKQNDAS